MKLRYRKLYIKCIYKIQNIVIIFIFTFPGTPVLGSKKLELTRENLTAFFSNHGTLKPKSQPPSVFSRGSNQTSGGRGPGKQSLTNLHKLQL